MLSAVGLVEQKIIFPKCRRLVSMNPGAVVAYITEMDQQLDISQIDERMHVLEEATANELPRPEEYQAIADRLDKLTIEIQ